MTGYVLWEGPSSWDGTPIALIATMKSSNGKTGNMVQTWILGQEDNPVEAIKTGGDAAICGDCPFRGMQVGDKHAVDRACYVNQGQAPLAVWNTYTSGGYDKARGPKQAANLLAGHKVRLGSYGDPAMVPFDVVDQSMREVNFWTGYTHQWQQTDQQWAGYLMASCETTDGYEKSVAADWRSFLVTPKGTKPEGSRIVQCAADRERNPLQCIDCGMCAGTKRGTVSGAVSVYIEAHGKGAKYVTV